MNNNGEKIISLTKVEKFYNFALSTLCLKYQFKHINTYIYLIIYLNSD